MFLLRGHAQEIFPEQVGKSTKCTICAFCTVADLLRKFPEEVDARAGCGNSLCGAASSRGAGPCVVMERDVGLVRKNKRFNI